MNTEHNVGPKLLLISDSFPSLVDQIGTWSLREGREEGGRIGEWGLLREEGLEGTGRANEEWRNL